MMKRMILLAGMAAAMLTATAQNNESNPYIVKTKNVKKTVVVKDTTKVGDAAAGNAEPEAKTFMDHFPYQSMCDWKEGMRFMVLPEKYDLLVNTFHDANLNKEVSSARLRHHIMQYKGHEDMPNGRVHINFYCETDQKNYYYELPAGTFDDYCFGKLGVPTLAYLGDVDMARELLMPKEGNKKLITRTQFFRYDTDYDGEGYQEVKLDKKSQLVTVKAVGVGSRTFPVKIIFEDEAGNEYFQNVAISKTNSGLRDDEFDVDNAKFLFSGSFEFVDDEMEVSTDVKSYLNKTVYVRRATGMSSKGAGKQRDIKVPAFTGFIIDEIMQDRNTPGYYALTLRETESRRVYYKDVTFSEDAPKAKKEDFFGYIFGMGEGISRETSKETRAAIREGRVIPGMTMEEVEMVMGEETISKHTDSNGNAQWLYNRSNSVLVVDFNSDGVVISAQPLKNKKSSAKGSRSAAQKSGGQRMTGRGTSSKK